MRLVLFRPDIPQNLGTMLRFSACMGLDVSIIEPCGFPLDDRKIRRAGMDYIEHVDITRHSSWQDFTNWRTKNAPDSRIVLLTTKTDLIYVNVEYQESDILMVGRESAGVTDEVNDYADLSVTIPMCSPMRSLNVAISASMVAGEALRQVRF
jgi:tRNA (cytidine/uridine-2'-O-)-methyltransferase